MEKPKAEVTARSYPFPFDVGAMPCAMCGAPVFLVRFALPGDDPAAHGALGTIRKALDAYSTRFEKGSWRSLEHRCRS